MKRNVKKILVLMVLSLVGFSAFGCDLKVYGKWVDDVPCCFVKMPGQKYRYCGKYSQEVFDEINELRKDITGIRNKLYKGQPKKIKTSLIEEEKKLDERLKVLTGNTYNEMAYMLKDRLKEMGY